MTVLKSIFLILLLAIVDSTIVNRSTGGEMVCVLIVSNYLLTIIFFPISFKRFSFYTYFLELELGRARNFWYAIYEILDFWSMGVVMSLVFIWLGYLLAGIQFGVKTELPIGFIGQEPMPIEVIFQKNRGLMNKKTLELLKLLSSQGAVFIFS